MKVNQKQKVYSSILEEARSLRRASVSIRARASLRVPWPRPSSWTAKLPESSLGVGEEFDLPRGEAGIAAPARPSRSGGDEGRLSIVSWDSDHTRSEATQELDFTGSSTEDGIFEVAKDGCLALGVGHVKSQRE